MASNLQAFNQTITNPRTQDYLTSVLHDKRNAFVNNLTALVANSQQLQACEPLTVMYAGIKATALDLPLDPNLGFAYVIPFNNTKKGVQEAQFQIGYKGFIQLAMRSGQFQTMNVTDVREGELVDWNILTGEVRFVARPDRAELPVIGYAAYFRLNNGFEKTMYATVEEIEAHAKRYSQTYSSEKKWVRESSKWTTDFDAMAKKTMIKRLLSSGFAPLSVEMCDATTADQAVIDADGVRYVDNDKSVEYQVAQEIESKANTQVVYIETGEVTPATDAAAPAPAPGPDAQPAAPAAPAAPATNPANPGQPNF